VSKRTKFLLGIGVIAMLIIGWQVAAFAALSNAALPPSKFEIDNDANLRHDEDQTTTDWVDLADAQNNPTLPETQLPEKRAIDKETGQNDDAFKGGVKENTECPGQTTGTVPNNKSDLLTFHAYTEPGIGTHPGFLNLAWSRVSNPSGTTLMDFELNQSRTACGGGSPNVQRTTGDKLIEYSIDQGGARAAISVRTWNGTAWGTATQADVPSAVCKDASNVNQPCAVGTINSTAIPAGESDGLGAKAKRTFGEAQLDLRFLLQGANANSCTGFGSAMLKSRSSDQDSTQLKDFILPANINVNTCGTVTIIKQTSPRGLNQKFPFTSTMPATATDTQTGSTETCASFSLNDNGNTGTANSAANTQTCTVLPGAYTVTEGADPANFALKSPNGVTCTASAGSTGSQDATVPKQANINVVSGGQVTCTYVNEQRLGAIKITKTTKDASTQSADDPQNGVTFLVKQGAPPGGTQVKSGVTANDGTVCFDGLPHGTYTVHENVPNNYVLADPDGGDPLTADNDRSVTVDNNASCTDTTYTGEVAPFRNTPLSQIQVNFTSSAGAGITVSNIECAQGQTVLTPDPADGTSSAFDDLSETYKNLLPGTTTNPTVYTCTIKVDP
jgi:hypothetical protein